LKLEKKELPVSNLPRPGILVVNGDDAACDSMGATLRAAGYDVTLAEDGAEALIHLRNAIPAVIVADLSTPQIAGFEFLALVRRRFPHIAIAAMGEGCHSDAAPCGVNADVFYSKRLNSEADLLRIVADLIHGKESVPVWTPGDGIDARRISYVMLTCPECLREFPLSVEAEDPEQYHETPCLFCSRTVRYAREASPSIFPGTKVIAIVRLSVKTAANA
jgi:CheY-like chemotaxis protein